MEDLCFLKSIQLFNEDYCELVATVVSRIEEMCSVCDGRHPPGNTEEVHSAIILLIKGKVLDPTSVASEHLCKAMPAILATLRNAILATTYVHQTFILGNITLMWRNGKPHKMMYSCRGITVTSIFAKSLERIVFTKHWYFLATFKWGSPRRKTHSCHSSHHGGYSRGSGLGWSRCSIIGHLQGMVA